LALCLITLKFSLIIQINNAFLLITLNKICTIPSYSILIVQILFPPQTKINLKLHVIISMFFLRQSSKIQCTLKHTNRASKFLWDYIKTNLSEALKFYFLSIQAIVKNIVD